MKYHNTWSRANHSSSMLHFLILFKKVYPHGTKNRSTLWWPCSFTPPEGTTSPSLNLNLLNIVPTHEILRFSTGKFYLVGCSQLLLVVWMMLVPFSVTQELHIVGSLLIQNCIDDLRPTGCNNMVEDQSLPHEGTWTFSWIGLKSKTLLPMVRNSPYLSVAQRHIQTEFSKVGQSFGK